MAHNFKRGIDVNGNDEPNSFFVDGGCFNNSGGDDVTGDGSSSNPWKTITHAVANTTGAIDNIYLAPSEYINDVYNVNSRRIIGDTMNRDVIITDGTGNGNAFNRPSVYLENIVIKGYLTPFVDDAWASKEAPVNCVFIDNGSVPYKSTGGSINDFIDCIFINNNINLINTVSGKFLRCLFYNSNIVNTTGQATNFQRCLFDLNSNYVASTGVGQVSVTDFSHIESIPIFENGDNTNLTIDPNVTEEITTPALFVSPSFIDLAVSSVSPLLKNDITGNVGNVFRGLSFSPDQPDFVNTVLANPDIEIVNSELRLVPSVPIGESRSIEGFSIVASAINELTTPYQIGLSIKCEYSFEVRWADAGFDIILSPWKKFRLGEKMTQNSNGTTTGEPNYDWNDNQKITYKTAEGRLVLTQI